MQRVRVEGTYKTKRGYESMTITREDILDLKRQGKGFEAMQKLREYQKTTLRGKKIERKSENNE